LFRRRPSTLVTVAAIVATCGAARADPAADEAAIRHRLERWTAAFNARDVPGSCDLFTRDLVYSVEEAANATYETMCGNLARMLGRSDIRLHYAIPDIHEIIISGDLAVVRLTWTLTVGSGGATDTTTEEGMDVFRRQPDGRWSIARYIAFTTRPNKLLP
jgi:ketosteroid isomerase-like protein